MNRFTFWLILTIQAQTLALTIRGDNNIDTSVPFEQQPLYLESRNALMAQDYEKARRLISDLGKVDAFKARTLRSLGVIETFFNPKHAIDLFKNAYDLGDKDSLPLYLKGLALAGQFGKLAPYYDEIFYGALKNQDLFETFCLVTERLNLEKNIQPFLTIARRAPLEITSDNLCLIRLLMKYGEPQDRLLIDYLNREFSRFENSRGQAPLPIREFHLSDSTTIENYHESNEYKYYLKFMERRKANSLDEAQVVISRLATLAKEAKYQALVNADLAYLAFKESDLLRVDQLCEVSIGIGDMSTIYLLFTSLIVQNNLEKAKKYEKQFFDYTFSRNPDVNPSVFAKYCLLTDKKEMFLKWVRTRKWDIFLEDAGQKALFLEGLEKWGESVDSLLIDFLKKTPPKSDNVMDFSFDWGVPFNGSLVYWDGIGRGPKLGRSQMTRGGGLSHSPLKTTGTTTKKD